MPNEKESKTEQQKSKKGIESPFLDEEIFEDKITEVSAWELHIDSHQLESPFLHAFEKETHEMESESEAEESSKFSDELDREDLEEETEMEDLSEFLSGEEEDQGAIRKYEETLAEEEADKFAEEVSEHFDETLEEQGLEEFSTNEKEEPRTGELRDELEPGEVETEMEDEAVAVTSQLMEPSGEEQAVPLSDSEFSGEYTKSSDYEGFSDAQIEAESFEDSEFGMDSSGKWSEEISRSHQGNVDCSSVEAPEDLTPEQKKKIKPGNSNPEGEVIDRTNEIPFALKVLHLTHYDVNDWRVIKPKHREALAEIVEFIEKRARDNPMEQFKVTISGFASRTGSKEYNDILSCKRAKVAGNNIRLGLYGYSPVTDSLNKRTIIDSSGQGFTAATCSRKKNSENPCENPDYRAVLVVVHRPKKNPNPIPPEIPGSCQYKIRCCKYKTQYLITALLSDLLGQSLPPNVQKVLEKYPLLKKVFDVVKSSTLEWLKKKLPTLGKIEALINELLKYIYVELIKVDAVFQIIERDKPNPRNVILCYEGYGFRVKKPSIPVLDKILKKALKGLPIPEPVKKIIMDEIKKLFKTDVEYIDLESNCAGDFENFDIVRVISRNNKYICTKRKISVFEGSAAVGTALDAPRYTISLVFKTPEFMNPNGIRLKCGKCSKNIITLPLGQAKGFEFFIATEGTLKAGDCKCVECPKDVQGITYKSRLR